MTSDNDSHPWRSKSLDKYYQRHRPPGGGNSLYIHSLDASQDEKYFVLWRGSHFFVVLHQEPFNNGHLLILPNRQVKNYRQLTTSEQQALADLIERAIKWLREAVQAEGYNVGMNEGIAVRTEEPDHLQVHVIPRWSGDTNFMAAVNDIKVVPESLEATYRRLREVIPSRDIDL